jgi:hypothetical protein
LSRGWRASGRAERPGWAVGLAGFCLVTLVFLIARDLFLPQVRDTEVWFGFEVHGWLAWLSAPIHWAIFATAAWAFWSVRPWVWPWASVYAFYVAGSHLVWNLTSSAGGGWEAGLWQLALFSVPAVALLWARPPRDRVAATSAPVPDRHVAPAFSAHEAHPFQAPADPAKDRCALCGESRTQIRHHPTRIRAACVLKGLDPAAVMEASRASASAKAVGGPPRGRDPSG